jgi:Flp pilus assembly protein TadD
MDTAARAQETIVGPKGSTQDPAEPDEVLSLAKSLLQEGRVSDADRTVRQFLHKHADSADGHFLLGHILFREVQASARPKDAAPDESYQEQNTSGSDVSLREANAKASLAEYTEGARYRAPSAFDLKIVALDYVLLGDYVDADKWLTRSIQWNPKDSESWYYLGRTKYNENRFEEAIRAFRQCLELDAKSVKAEDNLGLSYAGLGRTDDAIAAFRDAIAWQAPAIAKNPGPFINMGSLLLDQNRSEEAIPYLRQAIEISPRDSKPHELLGVAYSRLNQLENAQLELETAIELAPQSSNLHCMLGPVYRKQGLAQKARLAQNRCATLNGTHAPPSP